MIVPLSKFKFTCGEHRNKKVIWIAFKPTQELITYVKQIFHAKWSYTFRCWYSIDTPYFRSMFELETNYVSKFMETRIFPHNIKALHDYINLLKLKAYSPNTIKTYSQAFAHLLVTIKKHQVDQLSAEKIKSYLLYCIKLHNLSESQLHTRINAIKFYFEKVLNLDKFCIEIPRPKKPSTLPKVIDKVDIKKLFKSTQNNKHSLMLKLCYGMGLRVSELVNLKITDIDSNRMQVIIQQGKGKKDRYVNLPQSILLELRQYYMEYKPKLYLFEGMYGGQYSIRSVQAVFKQSMEKAKINKKVGIHSLRHSYATHLLEHGTDISYIQHLLGHSNIKTTLVYLNITKKNIANIASPLDSL